MNKEYKDLRAFLDDVHNELSIKQTVIDMGIIDKKDFKGDFTNCIFHDGDRTPSLQITENFWKCYACGVKGDLVSFLIHYYNTDFNEAVNKLSEYLNVNISNANYKFDGRIKELKDQWEVYLKDMENAPKEVKEIRRDFFPQEIGYDVSEHYVVLPLTSKTGAILGFTKRRIDFLHKKDNNDNYYSPKWKHSSLKDSLMNLCHNIFNLYNASLEMKKKQCVIITEGPKDVIAYQRIQLNNTICVCGTNNSSNIWDMILPIKNIILSMDGDSAGKKANLSTILFLADRFDIKNLEVVVLPEGEDPYSVNNLQELYDNRISGIDYFVSNSELEEIKELYNKVPDYNKFFIIKAICKEKCFSISETESWLSSSTKKENEKKQLSEKETLLAIVNCEDVDVPLMDIEKAKRILNLKYGIKV